MNPGHEVLAVNSGRTPFSTRNKYPSSLYDDPINGRFDAQSSVLSAWAPGELSKINDLVRESTKLRRKDFILELKQRLINPEVDASVE